MAAGQHARLARNVLWALLLLATVIAGGWLLDHYTGGFGTLWQHARTISPARWTIVGAATALFYLLDWVRYATLLSLLGHRLHPLAGLRLTCVSYFVSSLTPVAELHPPAMVFILTREGIPAADATAATVAKSLYMVLWICAVAGIALALDPATSLPPVMARWLPLSGLVLLALVAGFITLVVARARIERWGARVAADPARPGWHKKLATGLARTGAATARLGSSTRPAHLGCHAASLAFLFTYCCIGWLLCNALGVDLGLGRAVSVFSTGMMVAYLAPVPGSIGVTELATAYLLDPHLGHAAVSASVLLRFLCWYGGGLPGPAFLLLAARKRRLASG